MRGNSAAAGHRNHLYGRSMLRGQSEGRDLVGRGLGRLLLLSPLFMSVKLDLACYRSRPQVIVITIYSWFLLFIVQHACRGMFKLKLMNTGKILFYKRDIEHISILRSFRERKMRWKSLLSCERWSQQYSPWISGRKLRRKKIWVLERGQENSIHISSPGSAYSNYFYICGRHYLQGYTI